MEATYLGILFMVVLFAGFYGWYFMKVKKSGGYAAMFEKSQREKFGLQPGEKVSDFWQGEVYIGDLVPGSAPSTTTQVVGMLTGTTYRGRLLELGITTMNRLVISAEPREGEGPGYSAQMGGDTGYRPILSFSGNDPRPRPKIVPPEIAFAGHPKLKEAEKGPERYDKHRRMVRYKLAQLVSPDGAVMVFWIDPDGFQQITAWCGV